MRNLAEERELPTNEEFLSSLAVEICKNVFVPQVNQLNLSVLKNVQQAVYQFLLVNFPREVSFVSNNTPVLTEWISREVKGWEYTKPWSLTERKGVVYYYVKGQLMMEFPRGSIR